MATVAIGIICKAPNAGESKTRLIPRLGPSAPPRSPEPF